MNIGQSWILLGRVGISEQFYRWQTELYSREDYEAYEQLAIYYEHEVPDQRQALMLAREALDQLCRAKAAGKLAIATHPGLRKGLSIACCVSNARPPAHCWTRWTHSHEP